MRTIIADPTRSLILGRPGENEATQILFPIAKWVEQFGTAGIFTLVHKRYNDEEVYPCAVTWNTEYVSWIINSYDVLNVGIGKAVLSYTISGQIVKSKTFDTVVMETVVVPTEAPDPYQDWVSQITEMVNDIQLEVDSANEKLDTVETGAEVNVIESIKTADDVTLPISNKTVTLPSAIELVQDSSNLKYDAFKIRELMLAGYSLLINGQPILFMDVGTNFHYFYVGTGNTTVTVYRMNQSGTYYYKYWDVYLVRDPNAEQNKINAIKTADGTTLPISSQTVTLPDSSAINITGMTGNEIRTAWANNKILKYNGDLITSCQDYTYNSTSGVLVGHFRYAVVRNTDQAAFWFAFIPNTGTTITDVTSLNRVGLTANERSTGTVVQGNGGFVKGGQVFDAIQTWLSNLPVASTSQLGLVKIDGSTITINDGVISAQGGASAVIVNFSMENDDLVADKTIAEIATAYNNGSIVLAKLIDEDMGIELVYQLNVCSSEEGYAFCEFYSVFNNGENNVLNFAIIGFNEGEGDTWVSETPLAIPKAGQITSGDLGYATGGDVYTAIGNVESILAELIGGA